MGAHLKYPKIEGESEDDRKRRLSRDASMLCHDCNVAIGMMKDSPNRLRSAAQYLETEPSGPAYSCPS